MFVFNRKKKEYEFEQREKHNNEVKEIINNYVSTKSTEKLISFLISNEEYIKFFDIYHLEEYLHSLSEKDEKIIDYCLKLSEKYNLENFVREYFERKIFELNKEKGLRLLFSLELKIDDFEQYKKIISNVCDILIEKYCPIDLFDSYYLNLIDEMKKRYSNINFDYYFSFEKKLLKLGNGYGNKKRVQIVNESILAKIKEEGKIVSIKNGFFIKKFENNYYYNNIKLPNIYDVVNDANQSNHPFAFDFKKVADTKMCVNNEGAICFKSAISSDPNINDKRAISKFRAYMTARHLCLLESDKLVIFYSKKSGNPIAYGIIDFIFGEDNYHRIGITYGHRIGQIVDGSTFKTTCYLKLLAYALGEFPDAYDITYSTLSVLKDDEGTYILQNKNIREDYKHYPYEQMLAIVDNY